MAIVAGVDFGTLSVRVTLVDRAKGPVATATAIGVMTIALALAYAAVVPRGVASA